jgi:hypothetical protein
MVFRYKYGTASMCIVINKIALSCPF